MYTNNGDVRKTITKAIYHSVGADCKKAKILFEAISVAYRYYGILKRNRKTHVLKEWISSVCGYTQTFVSPLDVKILA